MTSVTDLNINMHPFLVRKLDLMIHRMEKKGFDNCILIDGKEGMGKTTLASQLCYYVSYNTKRKFSSENIYFRVKDMLEVMKKTSSGIFLLDEAELDLLSEQRGKMQRYFIQMLMAARKKNHFIVAIIPSIKKLKSYVIERAIGFIRVYSVDGITRGRYAYFNEDAKNALYENFIKKRKMEYKKYKSFVATFPNKFKEIIDEKAYEIKKDEAIASIGIEEEKRVPKRMARMYYYLYKLSEAVHKQTLGIPLSHLAKIIGVDKSAISKWRDFKEIHPEIMEYDE